MQTRVCNSNERFYLEAPRDWEFVTFPFIWYIFLEFSHLTLCHLLSGLISFHHSFFNELEEISPHRMRLNHLLALKVIAPHFLWFYELEKSRASTTLSTEGPGICFIAERRGIRGNYCGPPAGRYMAMSATAMRSLSDTSLSINPET